MMRPAMKRQPWGLPAVLPLVLAVALGSAARAEGAKPSGPPTAPAPGKTAAVPQASAPAAPAAPPKNQDLESAKRLLALGRAEAALRQLDVAESLPGNTDRTVTEIAAVRSEALLMKRHPDKAAARKLMLYVLHRDPDAALYENASDPVQELLSDLKSEHALVLVDAPDMSPPGLPVRIRARARDPKGQVASLSLHLKGHDTGGWTTEPMQAGQDGRWTAYIDDPTLLAPPGVTDDYVVDYFVSAEDASGKTLDSNGDASSPRTLRITSQATKNLNLAALEIHSRPPAPPPLPRVSAGTPWWRRWYTITGGAVVVAGVVTAIVIAAQPKPLDPHIGVLNLP